MISSPLRLIADLRPTGGCAIIGFPYPGHARGKTKTYFEHCMAVYPQRTDARVFAVLAFLYFETRYIPVHIAAIAVHRGVLTAAVFKRQQLAPVQEALDRACGGALVNDRWDVRAVLAMPDKEECNDLWTFSNLQPLINLFGIGEAHDIDCPTWEWPLAGSAHA